MKEIKELDNKYLVLKWDDIEKLKLPRYLDAVGLAKAIQKDVYNIRKDEGKQEPRYLVLNLDDEIDSLYLIDAIEKTRHKEVRACCDEHRPFKPQTVKDIAIDLVNAILKAKENHEKM